MKKTIIVLSGIFLLGVIFLASSPDLFVAAKKPAVVRPSLGSNISISELNNSNDSGRKDLSNVATKAEAAKKTSTKKTTVSTQKTSTQKTAPERTSQRLGSFVSPDSSYRSQGQVTLLNTSGKQSLRFDNFSVSNGPDLFVTLNKKSNPNSGSLGTHIKLGRLKKTAGVQEYDLSGINLSDYESVAVYCDRFSKVFAVAQL